ncbi:uncharacterized protein [Nicotiana sylvestris]|uniref:uncharacterized protein n=1 Tax=Nicotiana sylvestris TaxID=4096 RepID=UPI00388CEB2B
MIACLETRVKQQKAKAIYKKMGGDWKVEDNYAFAPNGRIWIMWKETIVHVAILESADQLIHCQVKDKNSTFTSYITFVYGLHTIQHRVSLWRSLRNIQHSGPWLIMRDFNSVLSVDDRINGQPVHQVEMADFQNYIDDIGVGQITKRGSRFSWSNKRDVEVRVYSHINWAFGNAEWFNSYTGIEAVYMLLGCSDHTPIMLDTEVINVRVRKPYRLLTTMMNQREYKETVQRIWRQKIKGFTMYSVWTKLKKLE